MKEQVHYTDYRVTSVVWETSQFNPGPQYEVIRFNEVPSTPGAIGNAVFAATGKRIRTLPMTPERIRA